MEVDPYTGIASAEILADPSNELRTTPCTVCGVTEVREKAIGRGLETVIKCADCGYEYCERNP